MLTDFMTYLDNFFFSFYPYICMVVFIGGCYLRFDRDQFSWQANSSQMMSKPRFAMASNLFHLSLLGLAGGHAMGLLVPHWVNEMVGVTGEMHQHMELVMGGSMGIAAFVEWLNPLQGDAFESGGSVRRDDASNYAAEIHVTSTSRRRSRRRDPRNRSRP